MGTSPNAVLNSNARVFILCAGESSRWANYLGVPKQLISFNRESLLARMVRLLREKGYNDIVVVSNDTRLRVDGCSFFQPSGYRWTVETLLSTSVLWASKNLVLLGDVYYTQQAINTIARSDECIRIYGRPRPNLFNLSLDGEIFAASFGDANKEKVITHAKFVCKDAEKGGRGKLWELYRSLAGFSLKEHRTENKVFTAIYDLTDDFDLPSEHDRVAKLYMCATSETGYKPVKMFIVWLGLCRSDLLPYLVEYLKHVVKYPVKRRLRSLSRGLKVCVKKQL